MSRRYLAVGIFIIASVTLFALGIFLVGSRHQAFSRHVLLYTEFADLDGVTRGSKVQVAGMDAGQVTRIEVPRSPSGHFRVQMKVDEQHDVDRLFELVKDGCILADLSDHHFLR